MNWEQARKLLRIGRTSTIRSERATGPDSERGSAVAAPPRPRPSPRQRASSVCIVSGKGGTGKSLVSASLARVLSNSGRTLLFDADLGCANAHILHDVHPNHSLIEVVEGRRSMRDIVTDCGGGLDLLPGGSGYARLAGLTDFELHLVGRGLDDLESDYRYLVLDSAAGLSRQTIAFAASCDVVALVTTPDVTALTDAYAFLKVFVRENPLAMPLFVVNRCVEPEEADHAASRLGDVTRKFLGRELSWIGSLPEDRAAFRATQRRMPVVESEPEGPLAVALDDLSHAILLELGRSQARGAGQALVETVGYDSQRA